ncbi:hypothetical protein B0J11DRAFT_291809 [Dendryphion nanum]|uniref:Pre-mRNA-splicing factor 38B n=1 Tax=Dendryphion nanum TaxID=256645 RepID=A0A9P9DYY7_9PLEO|nr:hypothetical protein B0J11DRAFT_291809 [Dendryphion nanum]
MMAGHSLEDDDHIANLLKEDAKRTTQKYEMVGLGAYLPKSSRSGALKPNTRFLRHIIRETDNHNAALLAKEAEESRARLKNLERDSDRYEKRKEPGRLTPPDLRDFERNYKRKRSDRVDDTERERSRNTHKGYVSSKDTVLERREYRSSDRHRTRDSRDGKDGERDSRGSRHSGSSRDKDRRHRHSINNTHISYRKDKKEGTSRHDGRRRSRSRSFSRSPTPPERVRKHYKSSRHHRDSRSRRSPHSSSPRPKDTGKRRRPSLSSRLEPSKAGSDSDPLEAIVGPVPLPSQPTVQLRGRGANKVSSMTMDARFSSTYDPHTDVHLGSDVDNDWGDALEALRDRERWKQQGGDRLRAAGFTDDQVKKWERGDEKNEDDVTWSKNGEGREWDRGKVFSNNGDITLKPDWGRLK